MSSKEGWRCLLGQRCDNVSPGGVIANDCTILQKQALRAEYDAEAGACRGRIVG